MNALPAPKHTEMPLGEDWIRHGNEVRLERNRPFLFVSPWAIRPTTGVNYRAEGGAYRASLVNTASENLRVAMESPIVIPAPMALTPRREVWHSHFRTVLYDGGLYRMWYEAFPQGWRHDFDSRLHYAESRDGIVWRKPKMRRPSGSGPGALNEVYPLRSDKCLHGASVFRDASDKAWPYKLVHWGSVQPYPEWRAAPPAQRSLEIQGAVSRDGLHWTRLPEPLMRGYQSDTQSVVRYNERTGKYVGFFRCLCYERRGIAYAETADFTQWRKPDPLLVDPSLQEDLYTNAYTVYPYNPDQHFLFPAIFRRDADNFHLRTYSSLDGRLWAPVGTRPLLRAEEAAGTTNALVCAGVNLLPLENGRKIGLPLGMMNMPHNAVRIHRDKARVDYAWMGPGPVPGGRRVSGARESLCGYEGLGDRGGAV